VQQVNRIKKIPFQIVVGGFYTVSFIFWLFRRCGRT